MSEQADPAQRVAIGISFGNSYSSIGFTTGVCADGGGLLVDGLLLTPPRKARLR